MTGKLSFLKFASATLVLSVGFLAIHALFFAPTTQAATVGARMPRPADYTGNNVQMVVATEYPGNSLDAPRSRVKIYSTIRRPTTIQIIGFGHCSYGSTTDNDSNSKAATMYTLYATDEEEDIKGEVWSRSNNALCSNARWMASCGNDCIEVPVDVPTAQRSDRSMHPGHEDYFVYTFEARMTGGAVNGFQLILRQNAEQTGKIGFSDLNNHRFALQNRNHNNPSGMSDFSMPFGPPCNGEIPSTMRDTNGDGKLNNVPLTWHDDDWGTLQTNSNFRFTIYEYNQTGGGGRVVYRSADAPKVPGTPSGVTGEPRRGGGVTWTLMLQDVVRPGFRYDWNWNNVTNYNGIQFKIPFDSVHVLTNEHCQRATCTATALGGSTTVPVGEAVTIRVVVRNTGHDTWNSSYVLRKTTPGPVDNRLMPGNVPGNGAGTASFDFSVTPRGSPGSETYRYRMVNPAGDYFPPTPNPLCQITITWGDGPPPDGGVEARCDEILISGVTTSAPALVRLSFDTSGPGGDVNNIELADRIVTGGTVSVDPYTIDGLYPHNTYRVRAEAQLNGGTAWTNVGEAELPRCMSIQCSDVEVVEGQPEPGQNTELRFGMNLSNQTSRQFDGTYSVRVISIDPGAIAGGPWTNNGIMEAGEPTNPFTGPFNATVNWEGRLEASLYFGGSNINSLLDDDDDDLPCPGEITPETRPFLEIEQGDVSTGGAFQYFDVAANGYQCPGASDSRFIGPSSDPAGNDHRGGIRTFGRPDANRGSRVDFAAFALGLIDGSSGGPYGFASSAKNGAGNGSSLSFANYYTSAESELGGLLGGTSPNASAHCVPDFFARTQVQGLLTSPGTSLNLGAPDLDSSRQLKYNRPTGTFDISGAMRNIRLTVYVEGDVFITNDITIPTSWSADNMPYFALIVKGNIHVAHNVTRIDGLYIAQPGSDFENTGRFSTCSPGGSLPSNDVISSQCRAQPFTLNGAVIARHVMPLRSQGTLFNTGPAETFNFVPSIVLGKPNFANRDGTIVPFSVTELLSLPPVF